MTPYIDHTDPELLALLAEGDESAFEAIYTRYSPPLYRYATSRLRTPADAEEIIQDTFLKLWTKRNSFGHVTSLKAYLYSSVRNAILDHIAHSLVRSRYEAHYKLFEAQHDNSAQDEVNVSDLETTLERTIARLPEKCQTIFRLSRIEQLSIPEIAQRMQLSTGTVENYISQALKHLRSAINLKM